MRTESVALPNSVSRVELAYHHERKRCWVTECFSKSLKSENETSFWLEVACAVSHQTNASARAASTAQHLPCGLTLFISCGNCVSLRVEPSTLKRSLRDSRFHVGCSRERLHGETGRSTEVMG